MDILKRNNVKVSGNGSTTMVFIHGFGCDQNMWRLLAPSFQSRFRTVLFDLVGSGLSDLSAYDYSKYGDLDGYVSDLLEVIEETGKGPVIVVGHSVGATIGLLASIKSPETFIAQIMVGPSPCYINEGDYIGGFNRSDVDDLLAAMERNYLGWSSTMAPVIMGAPDQPALGDELTNSFCRTQPDIARQFASVTFLSDHRTDVEKSSTPALILQCSDDIIAPMSVGKYMHETMQKSTLRVIENVGHCPHLSAPHASVDAMEEFLIAME
jgi:sigma-B regulation protein RsbQ